MNRLQSELHRLYLPRPSAVPGIEAATDTPTAAAPSSLIDANGNVRAMVLALSRPAQWDLLAAVWRGVQADLALPAPAIAVSGTDGFQLWFSLAEPISVARAHAFLASLCSRYLPSIAPQRLSLMPVADAATPLQARHAAWVPAEQAQSGHWSAFVAADLAPVFNEAPWLDIPPSHDGQADLLSRLVSIKPAAFDAAAAQLTPTAALAEEPTAAALETLNVSAAARPARPLNSAKSLSAQRFLLQVMNDDTVTLALRIEAAKALLPYADELP